MFERSQTVLLVNPNRMRPPIGPVGLEYVAAGLVRRGYEPVLCDLTFADDWRSTLDRAVTNSRPLAVGFSVRNLDDTFFASQDFVLEDTTEMIRHVQRGTDAPVVLGGIGFSCAPIATLAYTGANYGIMGEGENAFADLLDCLVSNRSVDVVAGLVYRLDGGRVVMNSPRAIEPDSLPAPSRRLADNVRYYAEGGQAGVEGKRGCPATCIYCPEPGAKGSRTRTRTPQSVADEVEDLLDQGISTFHFCDSEFNLPAEHARAVCEEFVRRGLGSKVRWYVYASVRPFDVDLAQVMARAGCVGINFGVDHADEGMLRRLGRPYGREDIRTAAAACRSAGLALMFDLLFGGPGESCETIARAIEFVREVKPDRAGLSCGVRLYPGTLLAKRIREEGPLDKNPNLHGFTIENDSFLRPIFFVESGIEGNVFQYVSSLVRGDKMFFHTDPTESDGNYNYNDNSVLVNAIRDGARGAYWDILRKLQDGVE